ncbi:MAG: hypothetical protein L0332_01675 [Chloroflexi bacterium]|nr:hypothetical protein [Chloroflexota bacterium]
MSPSPRNSPSSRLPIFVSLLLLALLLSFRPVSAHGGDALLQLANAPAGPFRLSVWTYPPVLRPGAVHFTVSVMGAASSILTPDTAVVIQATPNDEHMAPVTSQAILEPESRLYEADLVIQGTGRYQVAVQVSDSGRQGQATFDIEVVSATGFKWLLMILTGQAGLFALWLGKEGIRTWGLDRWFSQK